MISYTESKNTVFKPIENKIKHLLVIFDACYGGSMIMDKTRGKSNRNIQDSSISNIQKNIKNYQYNSMRFMASGTNQQKVTDNSIFTKTFINELYDNKNKYISDEDIFYNKIKNKTSSQKQQPIYGDIFEESAGCFVFTKKSK